MHVLIWGAGENGIRQTKRAVGTLKPTQRSGTVVSSRPKGRRKPYSVKEASKCLVDTEKQKIINYDKTGIIYSVVFAVTADSSSVVLFLRSHE